QIPDTTPAAQNRLPPIPVVTSSQPWALQAPGLLVWFGACLNLGSRSMHRYPGKALPTSRLVSDPTIPDFECRTPPIYSILNRPMDDLIALQMEHQCGRECIQPEESPLPSPIGSILAQIQQSDRLDP